MNSRVQRMFLRTPYLSIIFLVIFLACTAISIYCVHTMTNIYTRFGYDLFKRHYLWLKDIKIVMISFYAYAIFLMIYDLVIAYRSTDIVSLQRKSSRFYCLDSAIVQKLLYMVNYLTLITTCTLILAVTVVMFVFATLKALCTDGSNVLKTLPMEPFKVESKPGEIGQCLDLREFAPLIRLRSNETMYLYLENDRLKIFCDDYVSELYLKNVFFFAASIGVLYSMFNIVLIYAYNLSRSVTKKKLQELYYLNANELSELNANY